MLKAIMRALCVAGLAGATALAGMGQAVAISGGRPAAPRAYSFMVSLKIEKEGLSYQCGGTLIGERWVLTAGHCLHGVAKAEDIHVYAGSDLRRGGDSIVADGFWVHEGFDMKLIDYDIALIRLSRPPKPGTSVSIIKLSTDPHRYADLPPGNDPTSAEGVRELFRATHRDVKVAGWGMLAPSKHSDLADSLQVLDFRIANSRYCNARWVLSILHTLQARLTSFGLSAPAVRDIMDTVGAAAPRALPAGSVCASSLVDMFGDPVGSGILGEFFAKGPIFPSDGGDPATLLRALNTLGIESEAGDCPGDSGGPVFATEPDGSTVQVGVVSYGISTSTVDCGSTLAPSVYTSVAAYDGWIRSIMSGR
jgi:hypothetical protein